MASGQVRPITLKTLLEIRDTFKAPVTRLLRGLDRGICGGTVGSEVDISQQLLAAPTQRLHFGKTDPGRVVTETTGARRNTRDLTTLLLGIALCWDLLQGTVPKKQNR